MDTDVTTKVRTGSQDEEILCITQCACGAKFADWDFTVSIYADNPHSCPKCGRKFYFKQTVHVFEVSAWGDSAEGLYQVRIPFLFLEWQFVKAANREDAISQVGRVLPYGTVDYSDQSIWEVEYLGPVT